MNRRHTNFILALAGIWLLPSSAYSADRLYDALKAYDSGRVIEAERILERMVKAGDSEAMGMLAGFFETGQAGRINLKRSGELYHRAALAGERHASAKWADYLALGTGGVLRDIPQALCWFSLATANGHNWARDRLAEEHAKSPATKSARNCE